MSKMIDITGQKFGLLTVLERDVSRKNKVYWICQCDCGKIVSVESYNLRKGITKSCGCISSKLTSLNKTINLTGKKFGRLSVLGIDKEYEKTRKAGTEIKWICKCDCGNITTVQGYNLRSGHTQSCGCLNREVCSEQKTIDLTGQTFGALKVIEKAPIRYNKSAYWKCQCQCGKIIEVRSKDLRSGHTRSCGCLNVSKGEDKIKNTLSILNIRYIQQKTFEDLKYKSNLKFDFFLPDYNTCIEYQGEQHYNSVTIFGGEEKFQEIRKRDNIKKQWCKNNNVNLIEIPYWDLDKINENYIKSLLK